VAGRAGPRGRGGGGVIAGGVALRQVQLFTDREREARQAEREQARNDAREAFQRDTILALQDAVADLLRMVFDLHNEAVNAEEKTGQWSAPSRLGELSAGFDEQFVCVQGLRARLFDDALRHLVAEVARSALGALHADERQRAVRLMAGLSETNEQLQERVHAVVKELF
jgi:hypothetical protein